MMKERKMLGHWCLSKTFVRGSKPALETKNNDSTAFYSPLCRVEIGHQAVDLGISDVLTVYIMPTLITSLRI